MDRTKLLKIIEDDRDQHVAFLQRFVQAPTSNPPGDTTEAAGVILEFLRGQSIEAEVIDPQSTMPNIVSDFNGGRGQGPAVVMNGHIDVFPVGDSSDWKHGPWSGDIEDNYLYGRGTVDMKAGTAASVIAFSYLHRFRSHLSGSLALAAVSDEETGGRWGTKWLLNNREDRVKWRGDCMINAEPGGINSVRFGEKGTLRLTFTISTIGAHGAYLHLSEGANRIGTRLVAELLKIEDLRPDIPASLVEYLERPDVKATANAIMGEGAAQMLLRPTVNIGTWHGGIKVNMIPDHAVIEVDIRLPIGMAAEAIMTHIHQILKRFPSVRVAVQEAASNPSSFSPHDHPLLRAIVRNAAIATGVAPLAISSLGATDCKFYRYLSIPTYVYGVSPKTMASKDERVDLDEFMAVVKTHTLAVWDYLGGAVD
jgi:succinyl-diaminopimelate desuccinylase